MQLGVSVWFQRLYLNLAVTRDETNLLRHNLVGEMGIERPNSLLHDLVVRFDRIAARLKAIFVRDLDIAYVHDLLRMNELSFQVSFTQHQHARSLYRTSNPNPLVESPSPTLSVHRLNLGNRFLYHNSHINNFVCVLTLGNLDVLGLAPLGVYGLLIDLLLGDGFRFSARSS